MTLWVWSMMESTCWFLLGTAPFGLAAKPFGKKQKVKLRFYSGNFEILTFLLGSTKEPQNKLAEIFRGTSSLRNAPLEHL